MSQVIDWFRSNWPYLAAIAGGFVIGWAAKAYLDPVGDSPNDQIYIPPEMPENLKKITQETIEYWKKFGVPDDVIEETIKWAWYYTMNLAYTFTRDEDVAKLFIEKAYPNVLREAGYNYLLSRWMKKVFGTK